MPGRHSSNHLGSAPKKGGKHLFANISVVICEQNEPHFDDQSESSIQISSDLIGLFFAKMGGAKKLKSFSHDEVEAIECFCRVFFGVSRGGGGLGRELSTVMALEEWVRFGGEFSFVMTASGIWVCRETVSTIKMSRQGKSVHLWFGYGIE